jgi:hypothetical protein
MDYIIGNIIGISQTLVGHPFDSVKIRMQNSAGKSTVDLFKRSLMSGAKFPLMSNCIINSLTFGNYNSLVSVTGNELAASGITGMINGIVLNHFDYYKTNRQWVESAQRESSLFFKKYNTIGFRYSVLSETISIPIYFGSYHYLKRDCEWSSFMSGGIAGMASWAIIYPLDTMKTRKHLSPDMGLKELMKGNLLKGLHVTLIRAFIVNGCIFGLYDLLHNDTL